MIFSKPKVDWKSYRSEMEELEAIENNIASFKPVEIDLEIVKQVYTSCKEVADFKKPILATERIYNCTGILAYDLNKEYAFLGHSYGNEAYGIDNSTSPSQIYRGDHYKTPRWMPEASIHVIEMLDTLSKRELYHLKFFILVGSKPNESLVSAMINTIMHLRRKNISIESIELKKPFISGIHTENDVIMGKKYNWEWHRLNPNKEIVKNNITGEYHAYDRTRGASFAFDIRDGKTFTYNSDTGQYYSYDESPSVAIKTR